MARIPGSVIERLKADVSVQRLAEARGLVFTRHGVDLTGHCSFHEDHTPSLVVTPAKNLWHCFGACQAGGTVIERVMRAEGVSFRHAVELLQDQALPVGAAAGSSPLAASAAWPSAAPAKRSTTKKLAMPIERAAEDAQLLGQVIDYYHNALLESPEALDYLQRRGIGNEEAIRTFKLGFANRTLGYRLPEKNQVAGAEPGGQLQRIGVLRERVGSALGRGAVGRGPGGNPGGNLRKNRRCPRSLPSTARKCLSGRAFQSLRPASYPQPLMAARR